MQWIPQLSFRLLSKTKTSLWQVSSYCNLANANSFFIKNNVIQKTSPSVFLIALSFHRIWISDFEHIIKMCKLDSLFLPDQRKIYHLNMISKSVPSIKLKRTYEVCWFKSVPCFWQFKCASYTLQKYFEI